MKSTLHCAKRGKGNPPNQMSFVQDSQPIPESRAPSPDPTQQPKLSLTCLVDSQELRAINNRDAGAEPDRPKPTAKAKADQKIKNKKG